MNTSNQSFKIKFSDDELTEKKHYLKDGYYTLRVKEYSFFTSKAGVGFIKWKFIVVGGEESGFEIEDVTKTLKGKRFKLKNLLDCLGYQTNSGELSISIDEIKEKFIKGFIESFNENYIDKDGNQKDKIKNRIKKFYPLDKEENKAEDTVPF